MKNKSLWIKVLVCVFPFVAIGLLCFFRDALYYLGNTFPACPSYTFFDIYCPGCGNTRSVQHLLKGDILGSLRFNIVPVFGIIIGALAYIELIAFVFGKHIRIIPRDRKFWIITISAFSLYFIIRNFLRLF
ncbi:MAG TPA: DUF2752 domain-containing protein [Ruminiclostridium sp.]